MKTELRIAEHRMTSGAFVFEVWHDGKFLAEVTGADGPGIRVISKHELVPLQTADDGIPHVVEVRIVE